MLGDRLAKDLEHEEAVQFSMAHACHLHTLEAETEGSWGWENEEGHEGRRERESIS